MEAQPSGEVPLGKAPDPVEEGPDGYGSDTTYTGIRDLTDSSSSGGEAQCERACRCKAKVRSKKSRNNRRQGQKILNKLNKDQKELLDKFLEEFDDKKEELRPLRVIEPEGLNKLDVQA